jgi:hypothetical protein
MATGDVDMDGKFDIFLGGPFGSLGQLLRQTDQGSFEPIPIPISPWKRNLVDTDATFEDIDLDGDLDLLIFRTGPRSYYPTTKQLHDVLLNLGNNKFLPATERFLPDNLPPIRTVTVADIDLDGDLDIFAGGAPIPGEYPRAFASQLLINNNGQYQNQSPVAFSRLGLVTDAIWVRSNENSFPDLWITTEWGPIHRFANHKGQLRDQSEESGLTSSPGWWQCIREGDFDRDGDLDIIAGNRGQNTKYKTSNTNQQLLLVGDFGTQRQHLVECYLEAGQLWPHRGFETLSNAFPSLRQKFINFHQFSSATLDQIFTAENLRSAQRYHATKSESGIWWNQGNGKYHFRPLPALAQSSPIQDIIVTNINQDAYLDVVIAQNDFTPQPQTGRFDGGTSLILLGSSTGNFDSMMPSESGITVPADVRRIEAFDINGDRFEDLVFLGHSGSPHTFISRGRE